jgi:transposase
VRANAAFSRLLKLPGVTVADVRFQDAELLVTVTVALRRRRLVCPRCSFSTRHRHDQRKVASRWRHLDLGVWRLEIRAVLRRLTCPAHGVLVEGVPFARAGSDFTRDFECLVAWLATRVDKTAIHRLVRINWRTVGRIVARVCADELDPGRLNNLYELGIDEVAWRSGHRYLTLVCDHQSGHVVWGADGNGKQAADEFFTALGADRCQQIEAISMDMGPGYAKSTRQHAPEATVCIDNYHVVALANTALDEVRRAYWNHLRQHDQHAAKAFKGARWALLKDPAEHTDEQAATLRRLKRAGGAVWRAYMLKEALRGIFAAGLALADVERLLDRFLSRALRSQLKPFIRLAKTIRKHREGILAALRPGSPTPAPRPRTTRSGSSPAAPTASTPPRPPSPS